MTLEKANMTPSEVMDVRERDLTENYEPHDLGQAFLETRLEQAGFSVEQHGDDGREKDDVFFGDGPDLGVHWPGQMAETDEPRRQVGYVEVKTKRLSTGPEWFGCLNRRHWDHYVDFAQEVDVRVFIWFALVEEETDLIHRHGFVEITDTSQVEGRVTDLSQSHVSFDPDDAEELSSDTWVIPSSHINGVTRRTQLVDGIPEVHGNDVVVVDERDLRSFEWLRHELTPAEGET